MTEEVKPVDNVEGEATTAEATETTELTPVEQEMSKLGWKPKDQWEGDPDEWRSAKEFKERGELFKKISDLKRNLGTTQNALSALQQHQKTIFERAAANALADAKAALKLAVKEGDEEAAEQLAEKVQEESDNLAKARAQAVAPAAPPVELEVWKEQNSTWYQVDEVMTAFADAKGHAYIREQLSRGYKPSNQDVLDHVDAKMREKFPSAFGGKRAAPSAVGPGSSPSRPTRKTSDLESQLDDASRRVMQSLVDGKVMTKEQYLADWAKINRRG